MGHGRARPRRAGKCQKGHRKNSTRCRLPLNAKNATILYDKQRRLFPSLTANSDLRQIILIGHHLTSCFVIYSDPQRLLYSHPTDSPRSRHRRERSHHRRRKKTSADHQPGQHVGIAGRLEDTRRHGAKDISNAAPAKNTAPPAITAPAPMTPASSASRLRPTADVIPNSRVREANEENASTQPHQ